MLGIREIGEMGFAALQKELLKLFALLRLAKA